MDELNKSKEKVKTIRHIVISVSKDNTYTDMEKINALTFLFDALTSAEWSVKYEEEKVKAQKGPENNDRT